MKKPIITLIILVLLPMVASADAVEIGGIYYNLVKKAQAAEVTSNPNSYIGVIEIPDSIEYEGTVYCVNRIGHSAFYYCTKMTSIIIPNSVTTIDNFAFAHSGLTTLTIPNSVISIGQSAFDECTALTNVVLSSNLTYLGLYSFQMCTGLKSITIPNSLKRIESFSFAYCSGLTSIYIPENVTSIGGNAFYHCISLTSIIIPKSISQIQTNAFSGCSELASVYCYAEKVPSTNFNAFEGSYIESATLYVSDKAENLYKEKQPWNEFGRLIPICATPTIKYSDGELTFNCETEGVEFVYDVKIIHEKQEANNKVNLKPGLIISVYATKENYEKSNVATAVINMSWKQGDVNYDGEVDATDITKLIDILLNKNTTP